MTQSEIPPDPQKKSAMDIEREQIEKERQKSKPTSTADEPIQTERARVETPPPDAESHDLLSYIQSNQRDTIAYVVLVIGVILTLFQFPLGFLLVGIVAGLYFSNEIVSFFQNASKWKDEEIPRNLILGGVALALIIAAPFLFLGTVATVAIIELFAKKSS